MKITEFFYPKKALEGETDRERIQMPYFIMTIIFMVIISGLLSIVEIYLGVILGAWLLCISFIAFIVTLFLLKSSHIQLARRCAKAGLFSIQIIITFAVSVEGNPYALYRILSFLLVINIVSFLFSLKFREIIASFLISFFIWSLGVFILLKSIPLSVQPLYFVIAFIGTVAFLFETMILFLRFRMFESLNDNARNEKERMQEALVKITDVLKESRYGLEVGTVLSEETGTARADVAKMDETFLVLEDDASKLTDTAKIVLQASTIIEQRSEDVRISTQTQNRAITESSVALTEISANLSNVNEIASKRRKKMNALLIVLTGQKTLVHQALLEVKRVKESSKTIGDFIHTVEDIANQTGLLAMNASIEAAHAGAAGKGFAVIAQEIRKLSEETAKNAAHIGDALKTNEQTVEAATNAVVTLSSQTEESTDELQTTLFAIEEILVGISEMDAGTREVMNSMQHIVETSRRNGDLVDEVSKKISEQGGAMSGISDFAKRLQDEIGHTNNQLENIKNALQNIQTAAVKNIEVASSINTALGQIEVSNYVKK